jgi:hypothetical protein
LALLVLMRMMPLLKPKPLPVLYLVQRRGESGEDGKIWAMH